jgi:hypothetical protein
MKYHTPGMHVLRNMTIIYGKFYIVKLTIFTMLVLLLSHWIKACITGKRTAKQGVIVCEW